MMDPLGSESDPYWKRNQADPYEKEFNNGVREITVSKLLLKLIADHWYSSCTLIAKVRLLVVFWQLMAFGECFPKLVHVFKNHEKISQVPNFENHEKTVKRPPKIHQLSESNQKRTIF